MTPDEELANLIAARLRDAGLIDPAREAEIARMIATGTAKVDDWRFWAETGPAGSISTTESLDAAH